MDFQYFESLRNDEAEEFLAQFLASEAPATVAMSRSAKKDEIDFDYQVENLAKILKWILGMVQIRKVPIPVTEPEWIRKGHKDGLVEFEEKSKPLVLLAAYYLGETFVRCNPKLFWAIGNSERFEKNMPVVAGFSNIHELAPIMVSENVFLRIAGEGASISDIDRMVEAWRARLD